MLLAVGSPTVVSIRYNSLSASCLRKTELVSFTAIAVYCPLIFIGQTVCMRMK